MRALVKYLDGIGDAEIVGLNIPNGIPLVYELDDDAEADPQLLPRRRRGGGEGAAAVVEPGAGQGRGLRRASPARRRRSLRRARRRCRRAAARRARAGRRAPRTRRQERQAHADALAARRLPEAAQQARRADELDRCADRVARASAKRSATGCTGVAVAIAACSRLAWNGSRPCPVDRRSLGKHRDHLRPRAAHRRPGGRRAAHRACVRVRGRACRPQATRHAEQRPRLDVGLGDEARRRTTAWIAMMSSHETWFATQQAAAAGAACRVLEARCP